MMTTNDMTTNDTMKKTKDTMDDASECVPLVPAPPARKSALASTPRESTSRIPRVWPVRRWPSYVVNYESAES